MKKALLLSILLVSAILYSKASANIHIDRAGTDTAKINRKIKDLQSDMTGYQSDLNKLQKQLPVDSLASVNADSKAKDALDESKKAASHAVGGDVSDAKKAEKKAKEAADAKDDASDAQKQLDKDRKKIKKLNKNIEKAQKKIAELQSQV
jgi:peptidoglycan hydrolase CwlO-like protein